MNNGIYTQPLRREQPLSERRVLNDNQPMPYAFGKPEAPVYSLPFWTHGCPMILKSTYRDARITNIIRFMTEWAAREYYIKKTGNTPARVEDRTRSTWDLPDLVGDDYAVRETRADGSVHHYVFDSIETAMDFWRAVTGLR
jgi:hypothetical protein